MYRSLRSGLKFYFLKLHQAHEAWKWMCGVCFVCEGFSMIRRQRIKKDLIFWLDYGVEVQTCTEVVFLKSDEKTIFKTSLTHQVHGAAYLR